MATASPRREPFLRTCRAHLRDRPARRRCLVTALVVGTVLGVVNQGDVIARGDVDLVVVLKLAMNYAIPFAVSSFGFISARRLSSAASGAGRAAS